ncbi:MAG: DUF1614 domain-containing protein [candidate division WOR-3 bacterium]
MFFFPLSFLLFFAFLLLLPFLFLLFQLGIINLAFAKLGLPSEVGFLFFFFSLIGSAINLPLVRKEIEVEEEISFSEIFYLFYRLPKKVFRERIIAVNLGGCILPLLLSLYLLTRASFSAVVICTILMTLIAKFLSRPVRGLGIVMPAFIPPIFSAILALIFSRSNPAPVAYISGVFGVLIGADLLNLHKLEEVGAGMLSIGGAGVFDGIYLVGIIAVLIA